MDKVVTECTYANHTWRFRPDFPPSVTIFPYQRQLHYNHYLITVKEKCGTCFAHGGLDPANYRIRNVHLTRSATIIDVDFGRDCTHTKASNILQIHSPHTRTR